MSLRDQPIKKIIEFSDYKVAAGILLSSKIVHNWDIRGTHSVALLANITLFGRGDSHVRVQTPISRDRAGGGQRQPRQLSDRSPGTDKCSWPAIFIAMAVDRSHCHKPLDVGFRCLACLGIDGIGFSALPTTQAKDFLEV